MKIISETQLKYLLKESELLNLLLAYGVDNWEGWYSWEEEEMTDKELQDKLDKYESLEVLGK